MPTPVVLFSLSPPTGESINPRVAGLIGRSGPQNKQPFMVAFFKATEVHLRSIRSAPGGAKQRNPNRSKGAKSQEALRVANVAGKVAETVCAVYTVSADLCCCVGPTSGLIWLLLALWGIRGMAHRWLVLVGPYENSLHLHSKTCKNIQYEQIYMQTLTQTHNTRRTNNSVSLECMCSLHNKACNVCSGPLFWRCEKAVFMWSAETLDCNAWASNIPLQSLFIYTSITEQSGPSSLHGGKAAQAFMAEHICGVLWGNRGHNTWAKWACLELWIPAVFNWMMRTSLSWSFPMWTTLRN